MENPKPQAPAVSNILDPGILQSLHSALSPSPRPVNSELFFKLKGTPLEKIFQLFVSSGIKNWGQAMHYGL